MGTNGIEIERELRPVLARMFGVPVDELTIDERRDGPDFIVFRSGEREVAISEGVMSALLPPVPNSLFDGLRAIALALHERERR